MSNIPYISDTFPYQAGCHKHKLEPHKNRLEPMSVPAMSDLVGVDVLHKPVPSSREEVLAGGSEVKQAGDAGAPMSSCCLTQR